MDAADRVKGELRGLGRGVGRVSSSPGDRLLRSIKSCREALEWITLALAESLTLIERIELPGESEVETGELIDVGEKRDKESEKDEGGVGGVGNVATGEGNGDQMRNAVPTEGKTRCLAGVTTGLLSAFLTLIFILCVRSRLDAGDAGARFDRVCRFFHVIIIQRKNNVPSL